MVRKVVQLLDWLDPTGRSETHCLELSTKSYDIFGSACNTRHSYSPHLLEFFTSKAPLHFSEVVHHSKCKKSICLSFFNHFLNICAICLYHFLTFQIPFFGDQITLDRSSWIAAVNLQSQGEPVHHAQGLAGHAKHHIA